MRKDVSNAFVWVINNINRLANNTNLDNRLADPPPRNGQTLNLKQAEKDALIAFLKTLTGFHGEFLWCKQLLEGFKTTAG